MKSEEGVSLSQLLDRVENAIENEVSGAQWVRAEISEIKRNPSGHCYLTLVERNASSGAICAKADAIIWANVMRLVEPMFLRQTGSPLQAGMKVLSLARVQFSPQWGFSLIISDIDASFTLGDLEAARLRTIERLREEGMMDMNGEVPLPSLPRRLAVVTSATAAGWRDFVNHLQGNEYGYLFNLEHFPAVMQGEEAPSSIVAALDAVASRCDEFDAVLILRGGGSAMDLVCFDDYDLAVNVAQFPLPVLTGIGHDHDVHVVDMVAHTSVKTPTALADFIIELFVQKECELDGLARRLRLAVESKAERWDSLFDAIRFRISAAVAANASAALQRLSLLEEKVSSCDPARALERGCAFVLRDGQKIISASQLGKGDKLVLLLRDGTVSVTVDK